MMIDIAAGFAVVWMALSAYWMGKVLACLESIAKSLREEP
jgi:hypothetical protein